MGPHIPLDAESSFHRDPGPPTLIVHGITGTDSLKSLAE
jgi:hypothetical protein